MALSLLALKRKHYSKNSISNIVESPLTTQLPMTSWSNSKKCIQTSLAEDKDWHKELDKFLLNYRNTPHPERGHPSAQLMFNWPIRDKLPAPPPSQAQNTLLELVKQMDQTYKQQMKKYSDQKLKSKINTVKTRDLVLVQNNNKHRNNYTSVYNLIPRTTLKTKGNTILFKKNGRYQLCFDTKIR